MIVVVVVFVAIILDIADGAQVVCPPIYDPKQSEYVEEKWHLDFQQPGTVPVAEDIDIVCVL